MTFQDLEQDVNDLVRWADLTLSVCEDEMLEGIKLTEDGNVTMLALRHLVDLTRKLKQDYYAAYHA